MTRLTVVRDAEAAARHTAGLLARVIDDARVRGSEVHVAVAGGSTPRRAYELVAGMQSDWRHVHLWLGDERCVPPDDVDANQRMVRDALIARLRADAAPRLHAVRGELCPEDAAWLYASDLTRALGERPVLDLVLLGLGEDGHTASLFPGHAEAEAAEAPVIGVRRAPKPPPERITMTLPVLRRARCTVLLCAGEGKREALARVRAGDRALPPGRLGDGLQEVVCDEAAAGERPRSAVEPTA